MYVSISYTGVDQSEHAIRMCVAAPLEYVHIYSTRRDGLTRVLSHRQRCPPRFPLPTRPLVRGVPLVRPVDGGRAMVCLAFTDD